MDEFILEPGCLTLDQVKKLRQDSLRLALATSSHAAIKAADDVISTQIASGKTIYGVNTGFGQLAHEFISIEKLESLQKNLIFSHAAGCGEYASDACVQLTLLAKVNSLAQGYSGVSLGLIENLLKLYNSQVYPCIPSQGSVGASGDLAPLAHLAALLLGKGNANYKGKQIAAAKALRKAKIKNFSLRPKEGLALVNGLQFSTALALDALLRLQHCFAIAIATGSLTVEAACTSHTPFSVEINKVRNSQAQQDCARVYMHLLSGSQVHQSSMSRERVQDPYSIRCQPQVMGACLGQIRFATDVIMTEMNAVSDNPIVNVGEQAVISGGNFHGAAIAMAADNLALAIAEIGSMAERRIALLIDAHFSGLPAFLVKESGLNSGFMLAQVTAAALASENKSHATPASIDNIPTSANQEDHVSMATFAARRLHLMLENLETILSIELLAACQGLDFHHPQSTSLPLQAIHQAIRQVVPHYETDRYMADDIDAAKHWLSSINAVEWVAEHCHL